MPGLEVLTLPEAAAFLRVPEESVIELVHHGDLPAQRVGSEWRFLKRAIVQFLQFGPRFSREFRKFPWMFEHPFLEEMFWALEQRIIDKLSLSSAKPGSKQAVLKHFGVFKDDVDLEEQLAGIRARRGAAGE